MTPSKIFLYFCLSFIGGIFLSSFFPPPSFYIMGGGLIFGFLLISVFWPFGRRGTGDGYKKITIAGFCILFLVLGIWRHQSASSVKTALVDYNDSGETLSLIGIVAAEPDIREKNIKLTVDNLAIALGGDPPTISGRVLVTTERYPEYQYGDKLKVVGKLESPSEDIEGFNYRGYLRKDGIFSVMSWPKIELIEREAPPPIWERGYAKVLEFKNKLRKSIYQNIPPPQSSILGAMILGDKRQISTELKEKLNVAGVRHITAVSGLHVTVLSSIMMTLLIGLGLWRQQAFYFSVILIVLFIILIGLQPSAIRAGIMGGLFLLAQYFGRMNTSSRTIIFAAAIMLVQNPLLLKLDAGFQLSFLAILGIIYFLPIFRGFLRKVPDFLQLRDLLAMTISAQIFTLPILIYNFGYFSLVSPLTNVLIVPLLPYLMGLGFVSGITGIIFQPLGWFLALPAWLLLTYLLKVINFFSQPWAFRTLEISWFYLIIFYLILGIIIWRFNEKERLKFLNF